MHDEYADLRRFFRRVGFNPASSKLRIVADAQLIINELKRQGVTHALGLPDNSSAALIAAIEEDDFIRYIPVTREGEAFAIACGLWVGGAKPIVIIQNTGFFESGDAIRGCAIRMRIPLVCFIGYRGYKKMKEMNIEPVTDNLTPDRLSQPDLDSCAMIFEPTLKAWGIPYDFLASDDDLSRIDEAFQKAERSESTVALLITEDTT